MEYCTFSYNLDEDNLELLQGIEPNAKWRRLQWLDPYLNLLEECNSLTDFNNVILQLVISIIIKLWQKPKQYK